MAKLARETMDKFSSDRGLSIETKPDHVDPFAVPFQLLNQSPPSSSCRSWPPFVGNLSRTVPSSELLEQSLRITSSHFCDLEFEDYGEEEEDVEALAFFEEGHEEDKVGPELSLDPPPAASKHKQKKAGPPATRLSVLLLDQGLFTVYKRLFVACLVLNITALVLAVVGECPYLAERASLFSIANLFALVLCRSEAVLRVVFWLAVNVLGWPWVPLRVKTMTTSLLQSLGGIHSGCGISSIAWLVYALVLTLKDRESTSPEIVGIAFAILGLLCLGATAAFPLVRHLHHNIFERTHRFAGWSGLSLLWCFVLLKISYEPLTKVYRSDISSELAKSEEFWFTLGVTILIVVPWLTVRRVPVRVSSPSGHATIIKFEGGVKSGILGRISPSPLSEWHAFGIISDNKKEHMMLAGAVGDFTKSLVTNPPSHLWVRQVHFAGLPYLTNMFNRVLLVATGSGICVFLSFILQPSRAEVCILWITKGVEQNFGREITDWITGHPKDKVIVHDTAVLGRPNVSEMSVATAKSFGAEVVIVTSNPVGSRDVVNACKKHGIPAFGPIWDS